jgi:hypothetical protein
MASYKVGTLLVAALMCVTLLGCKRAPAIQRESHLEGTARHNGKQWLAWDVYERDDFISAYIDGYQFGVLDACDVTDRLLDLKPSRTYEHAKDEIVLPSGVCRKGAPHYSKFKFVETGDADLGAYTGVLTRFYTAHPEYQNIPFEYLMQYLSDEQNKTADDLYNMAKAGEMRTNW